MRSLFAPVIACQNWISVTACAGTPKPRSADATARLRNAEAHFDMFPPKEFRTLRQDDAIDGWQFYGKSPGNRSGVNRPRRARHARPPERARPRRRDDDRGPSAYMRWARRT